MSDDFYCLFQPQPRLSIINKSLITKKRQKTAIFDSDRSEID